MQFKIRSQIFAFSFLLLAALTISAQIGPPPAFTNERFVIRALATLHAAEMTYRSTTGGGDFATLTQLRNAGFIDDALASGAKFGYLFVLTPQLDSFSITAVPIRYRKSGRWSYYIDQFGLIYGGDRQGQPADATDNYVDGCALYGMAENERCAVLAVRTLFSAESTFITSTGHNRYGDFQELYAAGLIDRILATAFKHRYLYQILWQSGPNPVLKIWATPQQYGITGRRSFYTDTTGVVRGADHGGAYAGPDDPPID